MSKPPFFKNRSGHRIDPAGRTMDGSVVQQPLFESFRLRVVTDGLFEQLPFEGQADAVRSLVAFAAASPSFRGLERGEQGFAHRRGTKDRLTHTFGPNTRSLRPGLATTLLFRAQPGPAGRLKPCSNAAMSKSTLARSS